MDPHPPRPLYHRGRVAAKRDTADGRGGVWLPRGVGRGSWARRPRPYILPLLPQRVQGRTGVGMIGKGC